MILERYIVSDSLLSLFYSRLSLAGSKKENKF